MVTVVLLSLVTKTLMEPLFVPTSCFPKLRAVWERTICALVARPVPLRVTLCGCPVALSGIVRVPVMDPVVVGENATVMLQLVLIPRVVPLQLSPANEKLLVSVDVTILTGWLPELLIVTVRLLVLVV